MTTETSHPVVTRAVTRERVPEPVPAHEPHAFYDVVKRGMDIAGGAVLLVLAAPILSAASATVALTMRSNPLFFQQRVGLCGRPFTLIKVKTMWDGASGSIPRNLDETHGPTFKSRADPRVTRVGRFLRKTSIDELPQLLNVVMGHMSLVGPRPLPFEDYEHRDEGATSPHALESMASRLRVKPGLTGLWQVLGRSDIAFDRWMALDDEYVRRRSLLFDLWLLLRTVPAVVFMRGAH